MGRSIAGILGFVFVIGTILCLMRFVGPDLRLCRVAGKGKAQRTVCFGVLEFRGEDFWSFARVRPYHKYKD